MLEGIRIVYNLEEFYKIEKRIISMASKFDDREYFKVLFYKRREAKLIPICALDDELLAEAVLFYKFKHHIYVIDRWTIPGEIDFLDITNEEYLIEYINNIDDFSIVDRLNIIRAFKEAYEGKNSV